MILAFLGKNSGGHRHCFRCPRLELQRPNCSWDSVALLPALNLMSFSTSLVYRGMRCMKTLEACMSSQNAHSSTWCLILRAFLHVKCFSRSHLRKNSFPTNDLPQAHSELERFLKPQSRPAGQRVVVLSFTGFLNWLAYYIISLDVTKDVDWSSSV